MSQVTTVADVVADLLRLPQGLPVLVSCHYDNDDGLRPVTSVGVDHVIHSEAEFYTGWDPADPASFAVVTLT